MYAIRSYYAKRLDDEKTAREADVKHRRQVNREAMESLLEHSGLSDLQAKAVITAIAKGKIAHVNITY